MADIFMKEKRRQRSAWLVHILKVFMSCFAKIINK